MLCALAMGGDNDGSAFVKFEVVKECRPDICVSGVKSPHSPGCIAIRVHPVMCLAVTGREYPAVAIEYAGLVEDAGVIGFDVQAVVSKIGIELLCSCAVGECCGMNKEYIYGTVLPDVPERFRHTVRWIFFIGMGCPEVEVAVIRNGCLDVARLGF